MSGDKSPWRVPRWPEPTRPRDVDQVPELSPEELRRRIDVHGGGAPREPPAIPRDPRQGDLPRDTPPLEPERSFALGAVTPDAEPRLDRRRLLWRDSATILIFVVIALLAAQMLGTGNTGVPASSSAIPSDIVVGSLPPGFSLPPGVTFGPIVDPSIGIDATPTPIPAITEAPTPTPEPTPKPTLKATPRPTPRPSKTPTPIPTLPPPTLPPPTLPPPTLPPSTPPSTPAASPGATLAPS